MTDIEENSAVYSDINTSDINTSIRWAELGENGIDLTCS